MGQSKADLRFPRTKEVRMARTNFKAIGAVVMVLLAMPCTWVRAGDAAKAKRDLTFAKDNAESGRWDDLDSAMKRVAADMDGLSDADKAPLLKEIAAIKEIVT